MAVNIFSLIALICVYYIAKKFSVNSLHEQFVRNIIIADVFYTLTLMVYNIQGLLEIIKETHPIISVVYDHQNLIVYQNLFHFVTSFVFNFSLFYSMSQAICIGYSLFQESNSVIFSLNNYFKALQHKSVIISYISSIYLSMLKQMSYKHESLYLISTALVTFVYFLPLFYYYIRAIKCLLKIGEGYIKMKHLVRLFIFPIIVFIFFVPRLIVTIIFLFDGKNLINILLFQNFLQQFYGLLDAFAYGWIIYKKINDVLEGDIDSRSIYLDYSGYEDEQTIIRLKNEI